MRRFGDPAMWHRRNQVSGIREAALVPAELPMTAYSVTAESGTAMSELTPLFLTNQGGMVLTSATDYGTLHAAGRPS